MMSLLLTVLLTSGATYYYFVHSASGTADGKAEVISTTGVQLDLAAIAHAEQAYFATNGAYGNLAELDSTGVIDKIPTGRDGFVYSVATSAMGFVVSATRPGGKFKLTIDQDLKVEVVKDEPPGAQAENTSKVTIDQALKVGEK